MGKLGLSPTRACDDCRLQVSQKRPAHSRVVSRNSAAAAPRVSAGAGNEWNMFVEHSGWRRSKNAEVARR
jgi:hypothetical protein